MTALTPNDRFISLSPAAGTTVLAYDFELMLDIGMAVTRIRAGVSTVLVLGVDFSFPGGIGDNTGGTLTLAAASLAADVYLLVGAQPEQRLSDFVGSQKFASVKMNADLDALTMIAQEHRRDIGRAWKAPYGQTGGSIAAGADGEIMVGDGAGNLAGSGTTISGLLSSVSTYAIAAAASATAAANSATAASGSATSAAGSATAAAGSASAAATSAAAAAAAQAALNLPTISAADADKELRVKADGSGYEKVYIGNIGYPQRFGTWDRTGVADSAAALNLCHASYKFTELGEGTFKVASTIALNLDGRRLIGAGQQRTILKQSTANLPVITTSAALVNIALTGITLDRAVAATAGGDGLQMLSQANLFNFDDIECVNQYNGLNLGPMGFGQIDRYYIHNCYAHGILMSNTAALGTLQWYINNGLIETCDGWGAIVAAVVGPTAVAMGDWDGIKVNANTTGGIAFAGGASIPIHGVRVKNAFIGTDGGTEIFLDTYGAYHCIENTFAESAGQGPTGRNRGTAASHAGHGVNVTPNNLDVLISGVKTLSNSGSGMVLQASVRNQVNGGWNVSNGVYGALIADGAKTRLANVGFASNVSGPISVTANASKLLARGCFPDTVNTNGQVVGTPTNDNADPGNVGEYVETVVATGAAVALTTATPANLASISLSAGDWDVDVMFDFKGTGTTTVTYLIGTLSLASATLDATVGRQVSTQFNAQTAFNNIAGGIVGMGVAPLRLSLNATTTVYAVAQASFGVSTCSVFGILRARRVR